MSLHLQSRNCLDLTKNDAPPEKENDIGNLYTQVNLYHLILVMW